MNIFSVKSLTLLLRITALFTLLFCIGTSEGRTETGGVSAYSGFSDIDSIKDFFIAVGDTQDTSHWELWRERNSRQRQLIAHEIAKRNPAFIIHLGDLTTRGSSLKHWKGFDAINKGILERKIPYFPVLGNHEFYGDNKTDLTSYFQRFPHLEERRWYSFSWKTIAFVMLDSNFSSLSAAQIREQRRWYRKQLEKFDRNDKIKYIIVCCHEPPFTNSEVVSPNEKVRDYFAGPFLSSQKTSLFLTGHAHTYEHFKKKGKIFIVSGGGGGPRQTITIDRAKRRYEDLFQGNRLRFFHFCQIKLRKDSLLLRAIRLEPDDSFSVADSVIIKSPK